MSEFTPEPIQLQGKSYLEVAQRVLWLRTDHPDAQIITGIIEHDRAESYALIQATINIPSTGGTAAGFGSASRKDLRGPVAAAYLEKAETRAIGRAAAGLGYGTLAALDDSDALADAPVQRQTQAPSDRPPAPAGASARPPASESAQGRTAPATNGAQGTTRAVEASTHETAPAQASGDPLQQVRARVKAKAEEWGWGRADLEAVLHAHVLPGLSLAQADRAQMEALEAVMRAKGVAALPSLAGAGAAV